MNTVRVVIPSLLGEVKHLSDICEAALKAGASPVVVANGRSLFEELRSTQVPHVTSRTNGGFAASVALGAEGDWDWLVILNDDIQFDPRDLTAWLSPQSLAALEPATIIHLDDEPARKVPTVLGVLLSVSLIANVARTLTRRQDGPAAKPETTYRSFSAVAIARDAWDKLGGLDSRYPFAYEDADFMRLAHRENVRVASVSTSIVHLHSQTGGRFVTAVLPVATWSALAYLTKWYGQRNLHRVLLVLALCVRTPIAALTMRGPVTQLRAIAIAARALVLDRQPSLPRWDEV